MGMKSELQGGQGHQGRVAVSYLNSNQLAGDLQVKPMVLDLEVERGRTARRHGPALEQLFLQHGRKARRVSR